MSQFITTNRSLSNGGAGGKLTVPIEIWQKTLAVFRQYGEVHSEGFVLWGGVTNTAGKYVTGLYIPRHSPQGVRASLSAEEARWLVRSLRERDEKLLAQVHSHPGAAYHSSGDDRTATSFHPGFISIVAPDFAQSVTDIRQCAVFEFDGNAFCQLSNRDVQSRLQFPSLFEERHSTRVPKDRESWIHSIGLNLKRKLIGWARR